MRKLYDGIQAANRFFALLGGSTVVVLVVVILYDVTLRYILAKPLIWSIDFGELAMLLIIYLPAGLLSQERGHVRVEFLVNRLSEKRRAILDATTSLLGLCFAALLEWRAVVVLCDVYQRGTVTMIGKLPVYPAIIFFAIGALFLMLQQLINLLNDIARARTGS